MSSEISSVAFIGSGKVAYVLSTLFYENGIRISGISSRNELTGKALANQVQSEFVEDFTSLRADLIVVSINDDSVKSVIEQINPSQKVVYSAGAIDLESISHPNCGVFYPLQTFTQGKTLKSNAIPILLEAKEVDLRNQLESFCSKFGFNFQYCDSEQRKHFHLSAVFLNNFINHLAYVSKTKLEEKGLNWELLLPLLKETCDKLLYSDLYNCQTGPARRGDLSIIQEHQKMLSGKHLEIYNVITSSILDTYKND
ncbi:MAG: DUF2520 domain-containing protein [Bacteroidetes bacterium]|nr:DUF2520 domain-containing protein [Bacteroidota bacterium]